MCGDISRRKLKKRLWVISISNNRAYNQPHPKPKKHKLEVAVVNLEDTMKTIAFDLPGRYPVTSSGRHKFVFFIYNRDSNYIKPILMKLRETSEMLRCYNEGVTFFKITGFNPVLINKSR